MAITEVGKSDLTATASDLSDIESDNSDLPSADIPIAIGSPQEWEALPMDNLVDYLGSAQAPTLLWESTNGYDTTDTDVDLDTGNFSDYNFICLIAGNNDARQVPKTIPSAVFSAAGDDILITANNSDNIARMGISITDSNTFQIDFVNAGGSSYDYKLYKIYGW